MSKRVPLAKPITKHPDPGIMAMREDGFEVLFRNKRDIVIYKDGKHVASISRAARTLLDDRDVRAVLGLCQGPEPLDYLDIWGRGTLGAVAIVRESGRETVIEAPERCWFLVSKEEHVMRINRRRFVGVKDVHLVDAWDDRNNVLMVRL